MKNYYLPLLFFLAILSYTCEHMPEPLPSSYELDEMDLVPEGIAYSPSADKFYVSSVAKAKIIEVDRQTGAQRDFIGPKEFGYMPGVGILIDEPNDLLYALGGYFRLNDSLTSLFVFDLNSQQLLRRHDLRDQDGNHFLNDLIMDQEGTIYLTDSKAAAVYRLSPGEDSLQLFFQSEEIHAPNGIAIADKGDILYVASHTQGVRALDVKTRMVVNEPDTLGWSDAIDGLEFYRSNLYALQYGIRGGGDTFRKLILSADQREITGVEVISSPKDSLSQALTFCVADSQAVVISNSNLGYLDQVKLVIRDPDALQRSRLMVYDL